MMNCGKCGGRVFVDRMFQGSKKNKNKESNQIEIACVMCGKRWVLDKTQNRLAAWLDKKEKELSGAYGISSSK